MAGVKRKMCRMKRIFLGLLLIAAAAVAAAQPQGDESLRRAVEGRELKPTNPRQEERDRWYEAFREPDSLGLESLTLFPLGFFVPTEPVEIVAPMSSVVRIQLKNKPRKIDIIPYKVRSGWFTISNGQAQNWSPFPDAYLDARTLSFPHSGRR